MEALIEERDLLIRPMRDCGSDYALMAKWLSDDRVLQFYEGRDRPFSIEQIRTEFSPAVLAREQVTPCLLIFNGNPIGYLQFYPVTQGVYGMDQFLGEVELWNRGLGTRAVLLMLRYLFRVEGARKATLDPHADNPRAIRCYEKCGFRKVKLLPRHELHEGEYRDCWLMEVEPREVESAILKLSLHA